MTIREHIKEQDKIILALEQWILSQNLDPQDIGPVLANAAGRELKRLANGNKDLAAVGVALLSALLEAQALS